TLVSASRRLPRRDDRRPARPRDSELRQRRGLAGERPRGLLAIAEVVPWRLRGGRGPHRVPAPSPGRGADAPGPRRRRRAGREIPLLGLVAPPSRRRMIATVPLRRLTAVWIQVTGTWCNLQCTHCLNASGPVDPWLGPMDAAEAERHVDEAARAGAREVYFT